MRLPRVRITIGRLMIILLAAWSIFWSEILPRLSSPVPEEKSLANYKQAALTREVAEYAIAEYKQGTASQRRDAFKAEFELVKTRMLLDPKNDYFLMLKALNEIQDRQRSELEKSFYDRTVKSLMIDVHKAKDEEASKYQAYLVERAKRRGIFGF